MKTAAIADLPRAALVRLHPDDEVAVALRPLRTGEELALDGLSLRVQQDLPAGHKLALRLCREGSAVRKFGQAIGVAGKDIIPGEHVHSHNLQLGPHRSTPPVCTAIPAPPPPVTGLTFPGYRRADGRAGTRNYVAVISSVNCSASVSRFICQRFRQDILKDFPQVDGVLALTHKGGCAFEPGGEEHQRLQRTLAGFATHPNIGGYLLVGLGCETANVQSLLAGSMKEQAASAPRLVMQEAGGTAATVEAGVQELQRLLPQADAIRRQSIPASELVLGMECGGSDGSSGISANPVLGVACDLLVAAGGTAILSETPEVYGAESLLTRRARTPAVAQKLLDLIHWWEDYAAKFGSTIDNNPTPGNKAGGLTTIFEKSLGAVAKGGTTALEAVYAYAERVAAKGLTFMDSPGYDPPSVTGMVAGGANLVCFTTGRGSCFGCKPTPTVKVATNTPMFERLRGDMDFDAGPVLRGASVRGLGEALFALLLDVAGGAKSASERLGYGDDEFCPWSTGPVF